MVRWKGIIPYNPRVSLYRLDQDDKHPPASTKPLVQTFHRLKVNDLQSMPQCQTRPEYRLSLRDRPAERTRLLQLRFHPLADGHHFKHQIWKHQRNQTLIVSHGPQHPYHENYHQHHPSQDVYQRGCHHRHLQTIMLLCLIRHHFPQHNYSHKHKHTYHRRHHLPDVVLLEQQHPRHKRLICR